MPFQSSAARFGLGGSNIVQIVFRSLNLTTDGTFDAFVVKYTTSGNVQWAARIGGNSTDWGASVTTDVSGNVYATGLYASNPTTIYNQDGTTFGTITNTNPGAYIVKYTSSGSVQWVASIELPSSLDLVYAIKTDSSGNVYVTGSYGNQGLSNVCNVYNSNGTLFGTIPYVGAFLVKYNTNGIAQWSAYATNATGKSITIDSSGNVYIGCTSLAFASPTVVSGNGTIFGILPNSGYEDDFIVKYNSSGTVQWTARVAGGSAEHANSIAVDSSGNVYLVGYTASGYILTIYNADGSAFGTINTATSTEVYIVKYNSSGIGQWGNHIPTQYGEGAKGVAVDNSGNIYITGVYYTNPLTIYNVNGTTFGTLTGASSYCTFVIKYNTSGNPQWAANIVGNNAGNRCDGTSISIDSAANLYVTGFYDQTDIKVYNSNGTLFGRLLNSYQGGERHTYIVKYDMNGFVQWTTRVGGLNSGEIAISNTNYGPNNAIDNAGNLYVTTATAAGIVYSQGVRGSTRWQKNGGAFTSLFIAKIDTTGEIQWAVLCAPGGNANDYGYGIATDTSNNVYIIGTYNSSQLYFISANSTDGNLALNNAGGSDAFIVKYDTNGYPQWAASISTTGNEEGRGIATDTSANVYVTGYFDTGPLTINNGDGTAFATTLTNRGLIDVYIAKYNTTGTVQWVASIAGTSNDYAYGIATDGSGNVYIGGSYASGPLTAYNASGTAFATTLANVGSSDGFVVKYNTSGTVQWVARITGTAAEVVNGIATDASSNVYVIGTYASNPITVYNASGTSSGTLANAGTINTFVVKYNTSGVVQWRARIGGTGTDQGYSIATDSSGNVYVTGSYTSTSLTVYNAAGTTFGTLANAGTINTFVVKYNTSGVVQWIARIGGTGSDQGNGITTDTSGNVSITGSYTSSPVTIYNANGTTFGTLANVGGSDAFLVKYNTTGTVQWASRMTGTTDEIGQAITDDGSNLYITGTTSSDFITFNGQGF